MKNTVYLRGIGESMQAGARHPNLIILTPADSGIDALHFQSVRINGE